MTLRILLIATALASAACLPLVASAAPVSATATVSAEIPVPATTVVDATAAQPPPPPPEPPAATPIPLPTPTPTAKPVTMDDVKPFLSAVGKVTPPEDFQEFWKESLEELKKVPPHFQWTTNMQRSSERLTIESLVFDMPDGRKIEGTFVYPTKAKALPGLIYLHGYTGAEAPLSGHALQGIAALSIRWRGSQTLESGFINDGIDSPDEYVLRYAILAACRAVDALRERKEVDNRRIGLTSDSIGGGIALAAAALASDKVSFLYASSGGPAYRFLDDGTPSDSKGEMQDILKYIQANPANESTVKQTLRYFDIVNFCPMVKADVLMHVSLEDSIATPLQAFTLYQSLDCPKKILVFRNGGIGIGPIPRLKVEVEEWLNERTRPKVKPVRKGATARAGTYIGDEDEEK